jgi:hypothetical protein
MPFLLALSKGGRLKWQLIRMTLVKWALDFLLAPMRCNIDGLERE